MTPEAKKARWIHRAIFPDGRIRDSAPHAAGSGEICLAGLTQTIMRRRFPGIRVVHLVSDGNGGWKEAA